MSEQAHGPRPVGLESVSVMQNSRCELEAAIERLYQVFRPYKFRSEMDRCDHCVSDAEVRRLGAEPLRRLSAANAMRFASNALTTCGEEYDFKHFLPRLLELLALDPKFLVDAEIVTGKLRYGRWQQWPRAEQEAVESFLSSWWSCFLLTFPNPTAVEDADSCLCAIAQVADELRPFLGLWRDLTAAAPVRHLAEFVERNYEDIRRKNRLGNPFWEERQPQMKESLDWLLEPETKSQLERAFFEYTAEPFAAELSTAVQQLDWLESR